MKRKKESKKEKELSCQVCGGLGKIETLLYNGDDEPTATGEHEDCEWCNGSGIEPDVDVIDIRPDQVTEEDIAAIEAACCTQRHHWSVIPAGNVIAAATNHMMSVLPGRAMEGGRP